MYLDHVKCMNCGKELFIERGSEVCPKCGAVGCLAWANEQEPEVETN
jgi:predicted RNA-binding Zn-ribbon protein involved in translation (DUF1610 family)